MVWFGVMLQLAQADQHVRDINPHRTGRLTGAAQGRGVRQVRILADTVVERGQDAADRAGIDAAVRVTADTAIDRASIETGPAADTLQALAKRGCQNLRAPVVEEDKMKLLGTVAFSFTPRPGD